MKTSTTSRMSRARRLRSLSRKRPMRESPSLIGRKRSWVPASGRTDFAPDSLRAAVDVESSVADETEERHVGVAREIRSEARRGAYGRQHGDSCRQRLLHELVARASADEDQALRQRDRPCQPLRADQLVDRVVAADVLAHVEQVALAAE